MSLHLRSLPAVPAETAALAQQVFRRRPNPYLVLRETLGPLFTDRDFLPLYGHAGAPATSPALLAMVTLLQYMEDLTDRQAAEAVRSRIDWKYLLGLPLTDTGFDHTILHDFRDRLLRHAQDDLLLRRVLARLTAAGLVKAGGRQRTDSTHVLGAVSRLNRLELVGETMRAALNALAPVAPAWLRAVADPAWVERYGPRLVQQRLPTAPGKRSALERQIGRDGEVLLAAADAVTAPATVRSHPAIAVLRQVWLQQYQEDDDGPTCRPTDELLPAAALVCSPYDPDVRYSEKRDTVWRGYTVHLTETCEETQPDVVTQVTTTRATTRDDQATAAIQTDLVAHGVAPDRHLADTGYLSAALRVASEQDRGITLVGPAREDPSWQAHAAAGYAAADFRIDWDATTVTCPQGKQSTSWRETASGTGTVIQTHFRRADCQPCPVHDLCTHADRRSVTIAPRAEYEALQAARAYQHTAAFAIEYARRAGCEATLSQAVRRCDLRHARYRGLPKVRLQHLLTASALTLTRVADWLMPAPPPPDRRAAFVRFMAAT